ncbi:RagB/SusD family nutrient uptake outer membrane protein [Arenibacter sp. BSSL-BM3]|uniref:RagB/SusD family nutrient uptake outer membrane protein n=1 Tax=Arenibacter arenosicollis TaxID=2762274 RepID=A0ABR7QQU6_9FLAO|nr:RagB/SusD family nutrient uptake outer membrane protein [Arenibacter arenosicollis]MBC8769565.1 RagB/SusD family nutrient uptake outer membrane protein [Arenibacter arenosicollis]
MKHIINFTLAILLVSCSSDFLERDPYGQLTQEQISKEENLESLIVGAYSILNGQIDNASNAFNSPASNWSFGDVVSDDAYKGGGGTGDQNNIHQMEIFNTNPSIIDIERKWKALYEGVRRTNLVIGVLNDTDNITADLKQQRLAEMKFLRGHFYFELKKIYNRIPFLDENATSLSDFKVSNTELTDEQLWSKIEADFNDAYATLPTTQSQKGRPTKYAAMSYLAKVYLFQEKWSQVLTATEDVILNGGYGLMDNFEDAFLPENDNGPEVIFSIQQSINDGAPNNYNGSIGDRLLAPGGPRYPAYGFLRPTQNLVNAYKTNNVGLPTMDNSELTASDNVDPRIDFTLGRPGIPYKDLGILYQADWARDLATYGPYGPKKRIVSANSSNHLLVWPYVNAMNYYIIRYADVLLWRAEALIHTDDLEGARTIINDIRKRARDGNKVMTLDGSATAANYLIEEYPAFTDANQAMTVLRMERRLEFAHEGHRFFDLVRWGTAEQVINNYVTAEKVIRPYLSGVNFIGGKHEYFPIPQSQVDLGGTDESGNPLIIQNSGY